MSLFYINPSGTIDNAGVVMLSAKELLINQMNLAAQNLSNSDTVGFKEFLQSGLESVYRNPRLGNGTTPISYVQGTPVRRNTQQGSLKQTNNPLDFAINGHGYFQVQVGEAKHYTRDGRFRMDERGKLVTIDGYPVMGDQGEIDLSNYVNISISREGLILGFDAQGIQTSVSKLHVSRFNDEETDLNYVGMGRYVAVGDEVPIDNRTQVFNGFLEQSNVNAMMESVRLMRIMQIYQEAQKITEMDDANKTRTINVRSTAL